MKCLVPMVASVLMCGCGTSYSWRSGVPEEMRTVAVPTFRNESSVSELGAVATRQLLREFQREGTFSIRRSGDSSIEVQGVIKKVEFKPVAYARGYGMRAGEYRCFATLEASLIDKDKGKVLLNNRSYTAETTISVQNDLLTAQRNAVPRLAAEFARQIVDDALNYPYGK